MPTDQTAEEPQLDFLRRAKAQMNSTWDELAVSAGFSPKTFKNWRMPKRSEKFRRMPETARKVLQHVLDADKQKRGA